MLLAILILLLVASRVIAKSVSTQTKTNTDPNVPLQELTWKPELPPFPVGEYREYPKPIIVQYSEPVKVTDALQELIRRESSGNMYAVNSIGACGLGQSLPCSKMLNWLGKTSLSETTYEEQVRWMEHYIEGRYGTAENALAFHDRMGWY